MPLISFFFLTQSLGFDLIIAHLKITKMEASRLFQHTKDTSNNIEIIIRVAFRDNYSISRQVNLVEIIIGVAFRDSYSSSIWLKRVEIIIGVAFLDNYSSIENIFELIPTQRINKYSRKKCIDYYSQQQKSSRLLEHVV